MARGRKTQKEKLFSKETKVDIVWRIAVYIRLSREDGNDESASVVNQKKILNEYLEEYFEGKYLIADFYIDDGLTGTDDSREQFMRMIQDIEQGKVNCVLCKTLSRAFRNYSDQGYYLEYYFPQKNVRFISTGDPKIDTFTNPEALTGYEVPITGLMNDRYACRTSNDIRRTFNTKRRNGEFIGAFPPYGYLKSPENKNKLILDYDIVPIKRDMMNWVNSGMSLNGVAYKLNEMGIPNPSAYKRSLGWKYNNPKIHLTDGLWVGSTVKRVLLDKVNLGHMVQGKQRVISYKVHDRVVVPEDEWFIKENTHEPTFTQEEYDTLVQILKRDTRELVGKKEVSLFAGLLRCMDCKKAMNRKTTLNRVYYACRTYAEKSKTKCSKHSIRHEGLAATVLKTIQAQISLVESTAKIVEKINAVPQVETKSKHIEKLLTEKRRELDKVQLVSDNLYTDWKIGDITREKYMRLEEKTNEQILQINASIKALQTQQQQLHEGVTSEEKVFSTFKKYQNINQLDRNILIELVDTIYVHEQKEITIVFRYADELIRINEFVELNKSSI